jgi:LPS-assembly protein
MRVALLAALVLAGAGVAAHAAPATTHPASPLSIKGQMLMQADEADYDIDNQIVTARGHVEIDSDGRVLLADEVTYDQKKDITTASGHVSITDEKGNVAFSDHVVLTDRMRDGALRSFAALIGKSGRLVASGARRTEGRFTEAFDAGYTPCKICNQDGQRTPVWKVEANHVIYDQLKHKIVFRNAVVSFLGVPVFYTPYLSQPDPTVRYATGLLMPDLGTSTYIGYFARLPVYIALSDSNDLTFTPTFSTKGGEVLEGEYRQRWNDGGMWFQASVADNPNGTKLLPDGSTKGDINQAYGSLFGSGHIPIDNIWHVGFDAQLTTNDTYLKRYDFSQLDRLVNDLFVEADGGRTRFAITGYFFQGLQATDNSRVIPLALPLVEFSYSPLENWAGGQFRFDFNTVTLTRDTGLDTQRATAEARMRWPTILPGGQMLTVQADVRGDVYHVSSVPELNDPHSRFISRGIPYVALDWRWPFISQGQQGHAFIVEPIVQGVLQPYGGNPVGIPNDDSADFELDDNNILSFDQVPGYDLVESGPRMNVGMHARAVFPAGTVDAVLGQTFRLKPDPIFAPDSGQSGTSSDVVGRVSVKFLPYIDLTDRLDIDKANGTVRRHEVYLTGIFDRTTVQISYVQLPCTIEPFSASACQDLNSNVPIAVGLPEREEVNAQADVNFYENWQAFGAIRRDLLHGLMLDSELGLGYEDECFGFSVAYRRKYTTDRDLPKSTDIVFRFKLKTGDEAIEPFSLFPQDVFSRP